MHRLRRLGGGGLLEGEAAKLLARLLHAAPSPVHTRVYVSAGYDAGGPRHWPVTYYLAGTNDYRIVLKGHIYTDDADGRTEYKAGDVFERAPRPRPRRFRGLRVGRLRAEGGVPAPRQSSEVGDRWVAANRPPVPFVVPI